MKALIQRVTEAHVEIEGKVISKIGKGMLVLLGIEKGDTKTDLEYMVKKVSLLRIFEDQEGKMNCSLHDIGGSVLVVSQFTLAANCRKGNRPSFENVEIPEHAKKLYEDFIQELRKKNIKTESGTFGAYMHISLINDGPVTILLKSSS
jgi:D-tyrosyl-tRNA(Tyr) deacylase